MNNIRNFFIQDINIDSRGESCKKPRVCRVRMCLWPRSNVLNRWARVLPPVEHRAFAHKRCRLITIFQEGLPCGRSPTWVPRRARWGEAHGRHPGLKLEMPVTKPLRISATKVWLGHIKCLPQSVQTNSPA